MDLVGADGKVHQRPPLEGQQRLLLPGRGVARRPVVLVLADGVLHRLREVGLEFERGERDAVGKEHHVDAVLVVEAVVHLPHHAQPHPVVQRLQLGVKAVARLELAQLEAGVAVLEPAPQQRQRALLVQQLRHILQHMQRGVAVVEGPQLGPLLRLRLLQPADQVVGVEGERPVVAFGVAFLPAVGEKGGDQLLFKGDFAVFFGHGGEVTRLQMDLPVSGII